MSNISLNNCSQNMADNKKKESSPPLLLLPSDMQLPNFLGGNILIPAAPAESTFLPITRPKSSEPGDSNHIILKII